MSLLSATSEVRSRELTDGDLGQILDAFSRSGRNLLDLRCGTSRLRLGVPKSQEGTSSDVRAVVTAPHVGVFSGLVQAGQAVSPGMTLGHIRSLQGETEVRATQEGTITAQLVAEGRFVAFADPLFEILAPAQG